LATLTAASPIRSRRSWLTARRRRLLDQLLVAALQRAVALAEVDRGAVEVGEHLDLDVARAFEVALEVALAPAERGLGLALGGLERLAHLVGVVTTFMPRPPPPNIALTATG
jgi:hypothetical protein